MSDSYTTTSKKWYFSRIKDAIVWALFWIGLFIGSFYVLFTNEWTVDLSEIAVLSTEINEDISYEWQFVSKSWEITSSEKIWDNKYIKSWGYIFINRKTEMFSWEEIEHTETDESMWWTETTNTTYTYEKVWSESPDNSESFYKKDWHQNPSKSISSSNNTVKNANIDKYNFSTASLRLPRWVPLTIKDDILIKEGWEALTQKQISLAKMKAKILGEEYKEEINKWIFKLPYTDKYIFEWFWSLNNPKIWDIRISYKVFNKKTFWTIFWKIKWDNIVKYVHDDDSSIYHLFNKDRQASIDELHQEYLTSLWIMRLVWFLMMWIGLVLILNIFSILLAVIPFLAQAGRFLIWIATFIIALVLSSITILIWMIAHNIFLLIWTIVLIIGWVFLYMKGKNKKLKVEDTRSNNFEEKK